MISNMFLKLFTVLQFIQLSVVGPNQ